MRDHSMSEKPKFLHRDCRNKFRPMAAKYQKISLLLRLAAVLALGFYFYSLSENGKKIGDAGFLVTIFLSLLIYFRLRRKITCPYCHNHVMRIPDQFCPECGSLSLERETERFYATKCCSCGNRLTQRKRSYKIRYCTVCGAYLDEIGI